MRAFGSPDPLHLNGNVFLNDVNDFDLDEGGRRSGCRFTLTVNERG